MSLYAFYFLVQWGLGTFFGIFAIMQLLYGKYPVLDDNFDANSYHEHRSAYFQVSFAFSFVVALIALAISMIYEINILEEANLAILSLICGMIGCVISDSTISRDKI